MSKEDSWQISAAAAETYEANFVQATLHLWAPLVVDAATLAVGERVLDVACGTGAVARLCQPRVGQAGRVAGIDLNGGMLAVAHRLAPDIAWLRGNAEGLPFKDEAFDAVACQFGLMFIPDRTAALRDMWRVLAPGGRLVVAVWGSVRNMAAFDVLLDLTRHHGGRAVHDILMAPFALGETADLKNVFRRAGINSIDIASHSETERFESVEAFLESEIKASPAADCFDEEAYGDLVEDARAKLQFCCADDGTIEYTSVVHLATAERPKLLLR